MRCDDAPAVTGAPVRLRPIELADIGREEIMAAQTAIEGLAAELAATVATRTEIARLHALAQALLRSAPDAPAS